MEAIKIDSLSFSYPTQNKKALDNISFSIKSGEFVSVCGLSGSGKTTLLRCLKPAIAPHGEKSGSVVFFGRALDELTLREQSERIGFVSQSPDNQIVTDKVWHELAFGLESLGLDNSSIRRRVAETASFFGIQPYFEKKVSELSGGQKQLLNLASVMAMRPEVLILDEPTAQLDPVAAADFIACVRRINTELSTTVIISEHRLEEILPLSGRALVIEDGRLIFDGKPQDIGEELSRQNSACLMSMPSAIKIWQAVNKSKTCPVTVAQGKEWLEDYSSSHKLYELDSEPVREKSEDLIRLKDIWFRYEKNSPDILKGLNLSVKSGEFLAVLGGNGAGKSTLLSVIAGGLTPYKGKSEVRGRCALLPQNPSLILSGKTVLESLEEMLPKNDENAARKINRAVRLCGLSELLDRHPLDLSGGEQQRAAIAKLLIVEPSIVLLDEPTKGLDSRYKRRLEKIINILTRSGAAVIAVSHDAEFCASCAHSCAMMFNGDIMATDSPRRFFSDNSFYTTSASKISRGVIDGAVTAEDVIYCCTGKREIDDFHDGDYDFYSDGLQIVEPEPEKEETKSKMTVPQKLLALLGAVALCFGILVDTYVIDIGFGREVPFWFDFLLVCVPLIILMASLRTVSRKSFDKELNPRSKRKTPKRTVAAAFTVLFAVPLTIYAGTVFFEDQRYLFISLLVLFECMTPFFLVFEGRKPKPRELIIMAVLCAIAIASRSAFMALPQIKPMLAMIIISGVAFGGESGFMVGAVSMLISNIYFGQGPWTPWQMFAAGIVGFVSGILFKKGFLSRRRGALSVFGFFVTLVIYGAVMNFSTIILTHSPINAQTLTAFYAQGLPVDIIHAFSTLAALWFLSEPMLEKLDRVKTKYGIIS